MENKIDLELYDKEFKNLLRDIKDRDVQRKKFARIIGALVVALILSLTAFGIVALMRSNYLQKISDRHAERITQLLAIQDSQAKSFSILWKKCKDTPGCSIAGFPNPDDLHNEIAKQVKLLRSEAGIIGVPGRDGDPGKDGAPGKDGKDGKDGQDASIEQILAAVDSYCEAHDNCRGIPGKDGAPGKDGKDGATGRGILTLKCEEKEFIAVLTDGTHIKTGAVCEPVSEPSVAPSEPPNE